MASPETLRQELEAAASNYRIKNGPQWVEDAMGWLRHPAIAAASDGQLESAFVNWQGESRYPPVMSDIVKALAALGSAPTQTAKAHACDECQGNRMIELALWEGSKHLENTSMRCPVCNKGPAYGVMRDWARDTHGATEVIFGIGRALTSAERGTVIRSNVVSFPGRRVRYTPNPEQLDPYRRDRMDAEKKLKEEGWR